MKLVQFQYQNKIYGKYASLKGNWIGFQKNFAGHTLEAPSSCKNWLKSENFNFFIKLKFGVKKILKFSTGEIPKTSFSDSL